MLIASTVCTGVVPGMLTLATQVYVPPWDVWSGTNVMVLLYEFPSDSSVTDLEGFCPLAVMRVLHGFSHCMERGTARLSATRVAVQVIVRVSPAVTTDAGVRATSGGGRSGRGRREVVNNTTIKNTIVDLQCH